MTIKILPNIGLEVITSMDMDTEQPDFPIVYILNENADYKSCMAEISRTNHQENKAFVVSFIDVFAKNPEGVFPIKVKDLKGLMWAKKALLDFFYTPTYIANCVEDLVRVFEESKVKYWNSDYVVVKIGNPIAPSKKSSDISTGLVNVMYGRADVGLANFQDIRLQEGVFLGIDFIEKTIPKGELVNVIFYPQI